MSQMIKEDELLPDSCNDRVVKDVHRPPNKRLSIERLYNQKDGRRMTAPNAELIRAYQFACGQLSKEAFISVVQKAGDVLAQEANLLRIEGKVVIFGDIHGQFYDLCEVMRKQRFGKTSKKFLFLGDFVDRGKYGPEVVAYLFALKARYPDHIYLLRGNHETRECTEQYNFRE